MRGKEATREDGELLEDDDAEGPGNVGFCSRRSSHRSILSRYMGFTAAKNSTGAYPWRKCVKTRDVTTTLNVRRNFSSETVDRSRSMTEDG